MAETIGSGAAALLGNPGNPPPADGGSPPPGAGSPPPGGAPPSGDWLSALGVADPEVSSWATSKGWKSPADALVSHRNLEKLLGSEKIPVPKDANDAEGWDRFYKAAGRPDAPDGYGLDKLEGADPEFAKAAAEVFHASGMSAAQVQKVTAWYTEKAAQIAQAQEEAFIQQTQVDWDALQQEWGPSFAVKSEAARRAAKQFGIDGDAMGKLERALGTKGMTTLLANIGKGMLEAPPVGLGGDGGAGDKFLSPEEAQRQIDVLMKDPDFARAVYDGKAAEKERLDRLQRISVGR